MLLPKIPLAVSSLSLEGLKSQSVELKRTVPRGFVPNPPNISAVWLRPSVIERANTNGSIADSK